MKIFKTNSLCTVLRGLSVTFIFFLLPALVYGQAPLITKHIYDEVLSGQASRIERLPASQSLQLNIVLPLRKRGGT